MKGNLFIGAAQPAKGPNTRGIYRRKELQAGWERLTDGLPDDLQVNALVARRDDPRLLYLGAQCGLFHSEDGGDSWTECGLDAGRRTSIPSCCIRPTRRRSMSASTTPRSSRRSTAARPGATCHRSSRKARSTAASRFACCAWPEPEQPGRDLRRDGSRRHHPQPRRRRVLGRYERAAHCAGEGAASEEPDPERQRHRRDDGPARADRQRGQALDRLDRQPHGPVHQRRPGQALARVRHPPLFGPVLRPRHHGQPARPEGLLRGAQPVGARQCGLALPERGRGQTWKRIDHGYRSTARP